jgi:uncharacterized protein YsxB (DUF464 family)
VNCDFFDSSFHALPHAARWARSDLMCSLVSSSARICAASVIEVLKIIVKTVD